MPDTHRRPPSTSRLSPEEITNRGFASAFRGISETEVRNFLRRVADDLGAMKAREAELAAEIEALQDRIANPPPVTEQQLLDALGEETARVLRSAQDAAEEIRKRAEERAAEVVHEAQEAAAKVREEAEQHATARRDAADQRATEVQEAAEARATEQREAAEREMVELRESATREVEALREQAEQETSQQVESAKVESHALVDEARTVRERLLADLARRRSLLQAQVDELRSGRDRLLDAYRVVKHTLGDATDALAQVEARANAELAGPAPRVALPPVEGELEMLETRGGTMPGDEDAVEIDLEGESVVVLDEGEGPGRRDRPESADSGAAVDALFARLRASHTADPGPGPAAVAEGVTEAPQAPEAPGEPETGEPETGEPETGESATAEPEPETTEEPPAVETASAPTPTKASESAPAPMASAESAPGDDGTGDDALRSRRDENLRPITRDLTRRAKRALQDEHNEQLDKIRTIKGRVESAAVVPAANAIRAAWTAAVAEPLGTAYAAAAASIAAPAAKDRKIPDDLVDELVRAMADPWRERLVAAIDGAGDDTDAITQRLGARYREFRGKELDDLLGDALAAAWARGAYDATPARARLRWVPAEVGRCADCDDNALEPTTRTEPFPTGQLHPPAHPGCRCFLAIAT